MNSIPHDINKAQENLSYYLLLLLRNADFNVDHDEVRDLLNPLIDYVASLERRIAVLETKFTPPAGSGGSDYAPNPADEGPEPAPVDDYEKLTVEQFDAAFKAHIEAVTQPADADATSAGGDSGVDAIRQRMQRFSHLFIEGTYTDAEAVEYVEQAVSDISALLKLIHTLEAERPLSDAEASAYVRSYIAITDHEDAIALRQWLVKADIVGADWKGIITAPADMDRDALEQHFISHLKKTVGPKFLSIRTYYDVNKPGYEPPIPAVDRAALDAVLGAVSVTPVPMPEPQAKTATAQRSKKVPCGSLKAGDYILYPGSKGTWSLVEHVEIKPGVAEVTVAYRKAPFLFGLDAKIRARVASDAKLTKAQQGIVRRLLDGWRISAPLYPGMAHWVRPDGRLMDDACPFPTLKALEKTGVVFHEGGEWQLTAAGRQRASEGDGAR